jgi:hypothetical protein
MKMAAATLVLLAVGAILRFAITATATYGLDMRVAGDILMIFGGLGLVLWALAWAPWACTRLSSYPPRTRLADEERTSARRSDERHDSY